MKKIILTLLIVGAIMLSFTSSAGAQEYKLASGKSDINFIDNASVILEKAVKSSNNKFFKQLYAELFYTPIWVGEKGLTHFGREMMDTVAKDKTLDSSMQSSRVYAEVNKKLNVIKKKNGGFLEERVSLELELSRLYKAYVDYMIYGGINWTTFKSKLASLKKQLGADFGWVVYTPKQTAISVLSEAIATGSFKNGIKKAEPTRFNYAKLKKYLLKYIEMEKNGSWKKLPKFAGRIKQGKSNRAIPTIRHNLALDGDLGDCRGEMGSTVYDECLVKAVKRFQLRNGLKSDGVIGKSTYNLIDMPVSKKITLIRMNMDRIKRSRPNAERVRMELNIPSYRLNIFDGSKLVDTIRVVVGTKKHPTPIFGHKVQYIVINPWWKIPESIVKKEMLGNLIKDPYYYEKRGKILKRTWDENSERIDPGTIDWTQYRVKGSRIPHRFMQVPSRKNALGKIKFIFPNKFSVYIHDTPSKKLFFKTDRAFSHGCMRIQKPRELLKAFSLYNDNIDVEAIMKRLQGTEKKIVNLKHKIPVDITYFTVFVDPYGNINFRKDVYQYDKHTLKDYKYKVSNYKEPKKQSAAKKSTKSTNGKKGDTKNDEDGYQVLEVYPE